MRGFGGFGKEERSVWFGGKYVGREGSERECGSLMCRGLSGE